MDCREQLDKGLHYIETKEINPATGGIIKRLMYFAEPAEITVGTIAPCFQLRTKTINVTVNFLAWAEMFQFIKKLQGGK
jgi:hypothetical protein